MIFDDVKTSEEFIRFSQKLKKHRKKTEGKYCKIDFRAMGYEFYDKEKRPEDLLNEILDKRKIERKIERKSIKKPNNLLNKIFNKRKGEKSTKEPKKDCLQEKKEQIKQSGMITTDINIIIAIIRDIINRDNQKMQQLKQERQERILKEDVKTPKWLIEIDYWISPSKTLIEEYEKSIKEKENNIEWLEELNQRNEELTLEEKRKLLLIINNAYRESNIRYNVRDLVPLENMRTNNSGEVYSAPIPRYQKLEYEYWEDRKELVFYQDMNSLWKKYQKEFIDLGIDVKKYNKYMDCDIYFEICVNLDDISDLPIDYEKVEYLTKEELREIMEREEQKKSEEAHGETGNGR